MRSKNLNRTTRRPKKVCLYFRCSCFYLFHYMYQPILMLQTQITSGILNFQDSQCSDDDTESPASRGILEFSADKAGQDVTPLNFNFSKQRSTTLNSITGKAAGSAVECSVRFFFIMTVHHIRPCAKFYYKVTETRVACCGRPSSLFTVDDLHVVMDGPMHSPLT